MDLTDLKNWPDGAEACINGHFTRWINDEEYTFHNKEWVKDSRCNDLSWYEALGSKITIRPTELKEGDVITSGSYSDAGDYEEVDKSVDGTLNERGSRYGEFADVSNTTQAIKNIIASGSSSDKLNAYQIEALDMIASKIARIANGDPDYIDNWHDIAGYARLVEIELEE